MKKFLSALLAVIMTVSVVFALSACSKDNKAPEADASGTSDTADTADTASDFDAIVKKGKLVVGITDFAPMDYKDKKTGEWIGFDADLGKAVAEKMGVDIEFVEIDWDNKFIELSTGGIDCIWNGMTITDEVKLNSSVSKAYAMNQQVVVTKADIAADLKTVDDLKDLTFAVENGSAGQDAAKDNKLNATGVTYQSDALLEVKSGSVDACIIDSTMANAMTGEGTDYADLTSSVVLVDEQYGISFRKDSDMTEKMNAWLDEFKADGTLDKLAEQYSVQLAA